MEQAHQTYSPQPAVNVGGVQEPLPMGWGYASRLACGGGSSRRAAGGGG